MAIIQIDKQSNTRLRCVRASLGGKTKKNKYTERLKNCKFN